MGGDKEFCRKLDSCFFTNEKTTGRNQADVTGLIGQYCHGNEPSQHTAYLYAYSGQAYKTQQLVRQILTTLYSPKPDGICGNDDVGQMSAWYVMSSMGFYPVCPVDNQYVVASPLFEKITIHLENGKNFVIEAPNAEKTPYVQAIKLNNKQHNKYKQPSKRHIHYTNQQPNTKSNHIKKIGTKHIVPIFFIHHKSNA